MTTADITTEFVDNVKDAFTRVSHGDFKGAVTEHPFLAGGTVLGILAVGYMLTRLLGPGKMLLGGAGVTGLAALATSVFGDKNKSFIDKIKDFFSSDTPDAEHQPEPS